MADIIQLLPESIANQIAAGEVIQRPASVVKEMMENAIDAKASKIVLILKDSGKTHIQVTDNGMGMSETDARMSLERHATSKIKEAKDLFTISTMGFRGEALASIASIAHIEIKTRRQEDELGTQLIVHGSKLISQEYCQTHVGTTIVVKNLFYNVPARRKFLKKDTTELHHIMEEFKHVAIIHPEIRFQLIHNDNELFHLPEGNLRQRLVGIFGKSLNENLVPIDEETEIVTIEGYIAKPQYSKKTRGDQFLFVNNRFIKSGYLNHAIRNGYDNLLNEEEHAFYAMNLTIDPSKIDINIHPTKQEIKFEDERLIYNIIRVTIKHALAKYSIAPSLDFDQDLSFSKVYNETGSRSETNQSNGGHSDSDTIIRRKPGKAEIENWQEIYDQLSIDNTGDNSLILPSKASLLPEDEDEGNPNLKSAPYQIHNGYIISQIRSGFIMIDQHYAHERIMYERYLTALVGKQIAVQQLLFPSTVELPMDKAVTIMELLPDLLKMGLKVESFGGQTFIIQGVPVGMENQSFQVLLEKVVGQFQENIDLQIGVQESLALSMAGVGSIKKGKKLAVEEMQHLIDELFATENPYTSPKGKKCFITFELNEIENKF